MNLWVQLIGDTDRALVATGQVFPHDVNPRVPVYLQIAACKDLQRRQVEHRAKAQHGS